MKFFGLLQRKRKKVGSKDPDTMEGLAKEYPFDGSVSYNLLAELLEEDKSTPLLVKYPGQTLALWRRLGAVIALFPDHDLRSICAVGIELN